MQISRQAFLKIALVAAASPVAVLLGAALLLRRDARPKCVIAACPGPKITLGDIRERRFYIVDRAVRAAIKAREV
jgi:hypothetical protein